MRMDQRHLGLPSVNNGELSGRVSPCLSESHYLELIDVPQKRGLQSGISLNDQTHGQHMSNVYNSPYNNTDTEKYEVFKSTPKISTATSAGSGPISKKMVVQLLCFVLLVAAVVGCSLWIRDAVKKEVDEKVSPLQEDLTSMKRHQELMANDILVTVCKNSTACMNNKPMAALRVIQNMTCYCFYKEELSWFDAVSFCHRQGPNVHLVEVLDSDINNFLVPLLQAMHPDKGVWIGGSDIKTEGLWRWNWSSAAIDTYSPSQWDTNEPSKCSTNGFKENCIEIFKWHSHELKWNNRRCNVQQYFVCQGPHNKHQPCQC